MEKLLKYFWLYLAVMVVSAPAKAVFPFDGYFRQFREQMKNCSISYKMKCYYPDSSAIDVTGVMAVHDSKYFDSSNVRFALMDDKWYLVADHQNKFIAVVYLPAANKEIHDIGELSPSSYLFNEAFFKDHVVLEKVRETTEMVWVKVTMREQKTLEQLVICLLKKDLTPVGYTTVINYPLDAFSTGESEEPACMRIELDCTILGKAPDALFDHRRLIAEHGKKATLRRYNNYKTVFSNPQKG